MYQDVSAAIHYDPSTRAEPVFLGADDEVMRFAGEFVVPGWLAWVYLGSNIVLNTLNFYWFGKMIETVRKRFQAPKDKKDGLEMSEGVLIEGLVDSSTIITEVTDGSAVVVDGEVCDKGNIRVGYVGGKNVLEMEQTEARRRRG